MTLRAGYEEDLAANQRSNNRKIDQVIYLVDFYYHLLYYNIAPLHKTTERWCKVDSTRFVTRQTGDYVAKELYRESTDPFQVTIEVLVPEEDRVTERALRLYIDRTPMKEAVYRHPNGDFVFESQARLSPSGYPFKISISLQMGETSLTGASITVKSYVSDLIRQHLNIR